jgi:class 3 adenylate cyclase
VALGRPPPAKAAAAHATDKPQAADLAFALVTAVEPQSVPEGERKMVTALFVDIMDSTELGQNLDPEEARSGVFTSDLESSKCGQRQRRLL